MCLGGLGQLGIECAKLLRSKFGDESVILSDIIKPSDAVCDAGPYKFADILDFKVSQVQYLKLTMVHDRITFYEVLCGSLHS